MTNPDAPVNAPSRPRAVTWVLRGLLVLLAIAVVIAFVRFQRGIDFGQIWQSLGQLAWWNVPVLLGVLILRQLLSAWPLSIFIPGTTIGQALINDLGASTATAFAPAPSDLVLRVSMFSSWGRNANIAIAGTTMNAVTFFIARFGTPLLGFAILPFTAEPLGFRAIDLLSLAICGVLVAGVVVIVRAESRAARIGRTLGTAVHRVKRTVDPESWAVSFRSFQHNIADGFGKKFPQALIATLAMILVDLAMLTMSLRFVGVGPDALSIGVIAVAFLLAYPLTVFPAQGLGVVDTAVLVSLVATGGEAITESAVAALVIWRVLTIIGPLILGAGAIVMWRRSTAASRKPALSAESSGR